MFACMPCRSNCSRGFFNDQPEILMQQSTNIINLIESPDLCLESFDFSEVNAAHAVACFFLTSFKISRDLILGLRSSLLTLYGAGLGFSWQALPLIFVAARLCDSFAVG